MASSLSGGGLFPDNEEGTDQNDISERVLHLGPDSLGEFKETFKNGFQVRATVFFLGAISLGRLEVLSPKISINNFCKGKP